MLATHLFCFISEIIPQLISDYYFNLFQVMTVLSMVTQVCNITQILDYLSEPGPDLNAMTLQYKQFNEWLQIEVVVFTACLFGNILFLLLRAFVKEKVTLTIPSQLIDHNSDYLDSQQIMTGMFVT